MRSTRSPRRAPALAAAAALLAGLAATLGAAPAHAAELLSQGKPVTASSVEDVGKPAAAAVDGNPNTRWSSAFSDPQWLRVDLGATATVEQVVLRWEAAYATAFQIQLSDNGTDWRTAYSTTTSAGGVQTLPVSGTGRYVRVHGTARANGYGYSLWEFQVLGTMGGGNPGGPGVTKVTGTQGNWRLTVDGQPFTVKGLTWGPPLNQAAQYMPDVASMGVNTVRTWGTDANSLPLLDAAAAHGVKVINGFWLQPGGGPGSGGCVNYVTDATYKNTMLSEIQRWVNTYKTHPAVLMWNVGNESVLGLQNCYSGAELETQRNAYTRYVNDAARAIHAIDPNHPVTSTDAWTGAWPYYKANSPDLDLLAVNAYNDACGIRQRWIDGGYTKPYIVTEAGPAGEWEVPNDANGVPAEPSDVAKRDGYTAAWNCVVGHTGVGLGATLFHYGLENDFGGVWFNLRPGGDKRLSYYAVRRAYSGQTTGNQPPVITGMRPSRTADVPAGGQYTIAVDVTDPDGDPLTYDVRHSSKHIDNNGALVPAQFSGAGTLTVTAPGRLGVWKVYVLVRDGRGNIGIESRSVRVVPPPVAGTNIARGRPTTASSHQQVGDGAPFPPANATDGNNATRWASDWSDPQWLRVDLGSVQPFQHVQLVWEAAFGRAYRVEASDDGTTWRQVYATTTADGGVDDIPVTGSGRYVRITGTQRGTGWGYALYEFGVYRR
ncbi:discoidin domain-containing protein [Actinokineospora sp. 24-640]